MHFFDIKHYNLVAFVGVIFLVFYSCKVRYSFSGADISPEIKTISIDYFPNRAPVVYSELSQKFTEALKDRFMNQTDLTFVREGGDLAFEGEIKDYRTQAQAVQGNETAALNRLTVSVRVIYTNNHEPDKGFDNTFSAFADYESSQSLSDVEAGLVDEIIEQLTDDIFNKSVADW